MQCRLVVLVLLGLVTAGCTTADLDPEPAAFVAPTRADYPESEPRDCPPSSTARGTVLGFDVTVDDAPVADAPNSLFVVPDAEDDARPRIVWVWRSFDAGERPDYFTRADTFEVWRDSAGTHWVCARVDVTAPTAEREPLEAPITLRIAAVPEQALPEGPFEVVVNWVVGCRPCGGVVRGHAQQGFTV